MNAQTQISTTSNNSVGLLNLESFELSQRIAKMLSSSTLVPEQYRATIKVKNGKDDYGNTLYREEPNPNGLSNCIIALNMSNRMGADPLMIMQNLYLIEGRPAWSSQFIMAAINTCGRFSSLRFEFKDEGEKEVEYQETAWVNRKKQVTTKSMKIQNWTCYAWVIEKGSVNPDGTPVVLKSSVISMEMAIKEGWYQKNGSKWQTMPEQMLRYRAASFFGRVYAPELLMGLRSVEEEQDRVIDVTPQSSMASVNSAPDIEPVKSEILKAKTIDELDELSFKVDAFEGKDRNDLDKLLNAQYKKFAQPEVVEAEAVETVKKPESMQKEDSVGYVEVVEITGKTSDALKAEYIDRLNAADSIADVNYLHGVFTVDQALTGAHIEELKQLAAEAKKVFKSTPPAERKKEFIKALNAAKTLDEVSEIESQIQTDKSLGDVHQTYLKSHIDDVRSKLKPAPAVKSQPDSTKSSFVKGGIINVINGAKTMQELLGIAETVKTKKAEMTQADMQELLGVYSVRKKFFEDQENDMFSKQEPWIESAIKRIEAAKDQDDINAEYSDPMVEELSDKDKQRLDLAAQKREQELLG